MEQLGAPPLVPRHETLKPRKSTADVNGRPTCAGADARIDAGAPRFIADVRGRSCLRHLGYTELLFVGLRRWAAKLRGRA